MEPLIFSVTTTWQVPTRKHTHGTRHGNAEATIKYGDTRRDDCEIAGYKATSCQDQGNVRYPCAPSLLPTPNPCETMAMHDDRATETSANSSGTNTVPSTEEDVRRSHRATVRAGFAGALQEVDLRVPVLSECQQDGCRGPAVVQGQAGWMCVPPCNVALAIAVGRLNTIHCVCRHGSHVEGPRRCLYHSWAGRRC